MSQSHKKIYGGFVSEQSLPLFYHPEFMDVVSKGGSWDVSLAFRDNKVIGAWPYYKKKKFGLTTLTQPMLTPYLGPYILTNSEQKNASKLSFEKKVLYELINGLPKVHREVYHGHPRWTNWKPLHWKGYQQSTRYTYHIDLTQEIQDVFQSFTDKTRNIIKIADSKFSVEPNSDSDVMYALVESTFQKQGLQVPYNKLYFKTLHKYFEKENSYKSFVAYDSMDYTKKSVAGVYMTFDSDTAYLMLTGRVGPEAGGAVSSLIWKCIKQAKEMGKTTFDFEGSMIEGVDSFFRSFGGSHVPYHRITRTSNKLIYILLHLLNRI